MSNNIPSSYALPWYEKHGIEFQVEVNFLPAGLGLKQWLFSYEGAYLKQYKGYKCFWLRGWVRVLGIFVGGGIFFQGDKLDGQ